MLGGQGHRLHGYVDHTEAGRADPVGGLRRQNAGGTKEDADEWAKFEKMKPHMATMDQIKQGLSATHLDVHKADDISDAFCSHILRGLAGLTDALKQGSGPKNQRPWVMWEVELWARRVATLQAGNIGFYRFHASKVAE